MAKILDALPSGEYYREGTRVYFSGHLLVDTYTGLRTIEECESLAQMLVNLAAFRGYSFAPETETETGE